MEFLNNEQIITIVNDYLTLDIYNYAIMINGGWGSGKTYFIKQVLFPALEEKSQIKRKPIYVSLYGLKSTEEIARLTYSSVIESRLGKGKKTLPFIVGALVFWLIC
ncbi:MAG: P-loop NTPase fold protein [Oscillospiraceae bacterium]